MSRWYLVPTHLAKYYPQSSPLCFRGCGHLGTLLHTLWEYPRIRGYWNKIFQFIRKTIGIAVNQDPTIALINRRISKIPKLAKTLIHFILLGAKLTIAHACKSPSVSYRLTKQKNLLDNVPRKILQHYPRHFGEIQTYLGYLGPTYRSISLALGSWLPTISPACVTPRPSLLPFPFTSPKCLLSLLISSFSFLIILFTSCLSSYLVHP